jgi:hypothetical protein
MAKVQLLNPTPRRISLEMMNHQGIFNRGRGSAILTYVDSKTTARPAAPKQKTLMSQPKDTMNYLVSKQIPSKVQSIPNPSSILDQKGVSINPPQEQAPMHRYLSTQKSFLCNLATSKQGKA